MTGALLHTVTRGADGTRYLRAIVADVRSDDAVIATMAHELQHAIELLDASLGGGHSFDADHRRDLYQVGSRLWVHESDRAMQITPAVRRELQAPDCSMPKSVRCADG
jgi:hypothetical protein